MAMSNMHDQRFMPRILAQTVGREARDMREKCDVNRLGFQLVWPVSLVPPVSRATIVFQHPVSPRLVLQGSI